MKHLLLVSGSESIGKTTTLNQLIRSLWQSHDMDFLVEPVSLEDPLCVVGHFNNRIIGVITMGDPTTEGFVEESIQKCLDNRCDIIVGATRTKGAVLEIYRKLARNHRVSPITFIPIYSEQAKSDKELSGQLNTISSNALFQLITELCVK